MRTYDLVMLALLGIWWLFYRKKYYRNAVVLYYIRRNLFSRCFLRSADSLNLQAKSRNHIRPCITHAHWRSGVASLRSR